MDAICTMASIGRAIIPSHPVTQSFMGLCGLRQAQLAMSGGRVGPKAQGCLVENQSRMSMYFRDIQNKGQGLPANPNPGKPSERLPPPSPQISFGQINQQIHRKQAPRGVVRLDKGRIDNGTLIEKPHIHFDNGAALNKDGTWKHGFTKFTKEQKEWLTRIGWRLPQ